MANSADEFDELKLYSEPSQVKVGNGKYVDSMGEGSIKFQMIVDSAIQFCTLFTVLFVPSLAFNLLSVGKAVEAGNSVEFADKKCNIRNKKSKVLASGTKMGGLYYLDYIHDHEAANIVTKTTEVTNEDLWHKRYGHLGEQNLKLLVKDKMVTGLDCNMKKAIGICKPCIDGKHHRQKFPKGGGERASQKLQLVHTDVSGRIAVQSLSGKEYYISFIDDKSRFTWTYALKFKSDSFEVFLEWKSMVEKATEKKIKTLRSDNGGEYISDEFESYLKKEGIQHQSTVRKTPEQNGVAERKNRTLMEPIRTLLSESGLPQSFWAEALSTVTYLQNRSPTKAVANMTPYEAWYGKRPVVDHLRVFGCLSYAHIPKDERKKLDPKARETIFLGYSSNVKGYRLWDPQTKKVFFSRDVIFDESKFFNGKPLPAPARIEEISEDDSTNAVETTQNEPTAAETELKKSSRQRKAPGYYGEWVNVVDSMLSEPSTVKDALSCEESEKWQSAMSNEIDSLQKNDVWDLVPLPQGRKTVGSKWIYKKKVDADGNVARYKARLVAQGFTQKHGIDYDETFSPVVRFESIRTVIALASKNGLSLHQMDVQTAFLNGELEEDIYMRQPDGFIEKGKENFVCKLKRSLYGLKQSARCWNTALHNQLKQMGFSQCASDPCIYLLRDSKDGLFVLAVYVDDLILGGMNIEIISVVKKSLSARFAVTDMGELHHFLGVKIVQLEGQIWIGQPSYSKDLLVRFRLEESKPTATPMDVGCKLMKAENENEMCDKQLYQSAVGSLLYLSTRTRPDIAFAVGSFARFNSQPSNEHWSAVKRIMRYLKGTIHLGLVYDDEGDDLVGYSDADWAGDCNDRKSTSGYSFLLSGAVVSWRSKKQTCVALSTAEAEYVALSSATQEAIWMQRLVSNILGEVEIEQPTIIYEDNQSAMSMTKHQQFHGRAKHIDIRHHFVRDKVAEKVVEVRYCKTDDMIADILTKPLCAPKFNKLRSMMGMSTELRKPSI